MAPPARDPVEIFVAVGANLGDPEASVRSAIRALAGLREMQFLGGSSLYRSAPWQAQGPEFVNAVVHLRTALNALQVLDTLQQLEQTAGRVRSHKNAPRSLDLDLLFYGEAKMQSPGLTLPHPRWFERAFVLWPLQELAPHKVIPAMLQAVAGQPIQPLDQRQ